LTKTLELGINEDSILALTKVPKMASKAVALKILLERLEKLKGQEIAEPFYIARRTK
jgi:hypothetical protein